MNNILRSSICLLLIIILGGCSKQVVDNTNSKHKGVEAKGDLQTIEKYNETLKELDSKEVTSISTALDKYTQCINEDKSINDEMYRMFEAYYYKIINNLQDYFVSGQGVLTTELRESLNDNGLKIHICDEGAFIVEEPGFLIENFKDNVSDGLLKYLEIHKEELIQTDGGYLISGNMLVITWEELFERVIKWENYIIKYPEYKSEVEKATDSIAFYLKVLTNCIDINTFEQLRTNQKNNGIQKSYRFFLEKYPNSKYQPIIKGYYEILLKSKFTINDDAKQYLKQFDLLLDTE